MEGQGGIRVVRGTGRWDVFLARPETRNAFDEGMIAALTAAFREAGADPRVRCVVLSGEGPAFSAGADLGWMKRAAAASRDQNLADARRLGDMFRALHEIPCATVAKVHGAALGGGTGLAACVDAAIAAEDARLGFTEVRLGIAPAVISPFVVRRIGSAAARRWFVSGETLDGRTAAALGLVSEAVPAGDLDRRVEEVVRQMLSVAPGAARVAKRLADLAAEIPYPRSVGEMAEIIADLRTREEAQEGFAAFLAKRPPRWVGEAP